MEASGRLHTIISGKQYKESYRWLKKYFSVPLNCFVVSKYLVLNFLKAGVLVQMFS